MLIVGDPGSPQNLRPRVFIVEDHALVRTALAAVMDRRDDFELVGQAATLAAAARNIPIAVPDVILLDIRLPDGNGLELCRWLGASLPDTRCIILTGVLGEIPVSEIIAAGAADYLSKEAPLEELLAAIHAVARGGD